ncbi:MAG: phosphoribosylaminoimidazolesuccinocarboxamide synthase [Deltaproteobacteria bacterium]|nr:MAG: phosphoribosylaminoimidazolesuccinocarboxamide synthase [Deltaproteobacteria bacterium]
MGIDLSVLRRQCEQTLGRTEFAEFGDREEGKVRDNYVRGGRRAIVVTDRVSAFDVVVGTVPFKGQVLNQIAAFWFEKTRDVARNHLVSVPDPNVSIVEECRPLPVEFVYRAYLTGVSSTAIWTAYERGERRFCGHALPDGLRKHERLREPILTPTTKAARGDHDQNASREELIERGLIGEETFDRAARLTRELFTAGQAFAETRGLILVDTKYEIGTDAEGNLVVIDEIHTPDSSRYWYREAYETALAEGRDPVALDKEYVRRWLVEERGYRGEGPPPTLPDEVRCEAARRYIEAYELVTGLAFEPDTEEPTERIRRNLRAAI